MQLKAENLKLKPEKCKYFKNNLKFLSFHILINNIKQVNKKLK